jgi:hypothetical protein
MSSHKRRKKQITFFKKNKFIKTNLSPDVSHRRIDLGVDGWSFDSDDVNKNPDQISADNNLQKQTSHEEPGKKPKNLLSYEECLQIYLQKHRETLSTLKEKDKIKKKLDFSGYDVKETRLDCCSDDDDDSCDGKHNGTLDLTSHETSKNNIDVKIDRCDTNIHNTPEKAWISTPGSIILYLHHVYGSPQAQSICWGCSSSFRDFGTLPTLLSTEFSENMLDDASIMKENTLDEIRTMIQEGPVNGDIVSHVVAISSYYENKIRKPVNDLLVKCYKKNSASKSPDILLNGDNVLTLLGESMLNKSDETFKIKNVEPDQTLKIDLLPAWTPTDVFYHITEHHNLIMNDVMYFRSMLKKIVVKVHNESLFKVHPEKKNLLGDPLIEVDKTQFQTLMTAVNTWLKFANLPKSIIQQQDIEREARLKDFQRIIESGKKRTYNSGVIK